MGTTIVSFQSIVVMMLYCLKRKYSLLSESTAVALGPSGSGPIVGDKDDKERAEEVADLLRT